LQWRFTRQQQPRPALALLLRVLLDEH